MWRKPLIRDQPVGCPFSNIFPGEELNTNMELVGMKMGSQSIVHCKFLYFWLLELGRLLGTIPIWIFVCAEEIPTKSNIGQNSTSQILFANLQFLITEWSSLQVLRRSTFFSQIFTIFDKSKAWY